MKDKYKELGIEFKNEADAEEELDEEGTNFEKVDKEHFGTG